MKRTTITLKDIQNSACARINPHLFSGQHAKESKPKRNKYANTETEVDGIRFDSTKEANRYVKLKMMVKAGLIGMLQLQVDFELNPGGTHSLKYIADFVYIDQRTGDSIVEDAKGFRTKEYRKKKRLMKKIYQIEIKEV